MKLFISEKALGLSKQTLLIILNERNKLLQKNKWRTKLQNLLSKNEKNKKSKQELTKENTVERKPFKKSSVTFNFIVLIVSLLYDLFKSYTIIRYITNTV